MRVDVIIGFRDRGRDPLRVANLNRVVDQWNTYGWPVTVVDDGRTGDEQFNRSAAYNRASPGGDLIVYAESDMLVPCSQVCDALVMAASRPGMVVPFSLYHYLGARASSDVRGGANPRGYAPEWVRQDCVGAINVVSRETLAAVGRWDEAFEGSWYDDTAMGIAFERATGEPTRWVAGSAWHLYHLPGWTGDHLTSADTAATAANQARLKLYEQAQSPDEIRALTA